jgi:hypothetical protein
VISYGSCSWRAIAKTAEVTRRAESKSNGQVTRLDGYLNGYKLVPTFRAHAANALFNALFLRISLIELFQHVFQDRRAVGNALSGSPILRLMLTRERLQIR